MSKKCEGCGIELQDKDKAQSGYVANIDHDLCQRCFKLINYNEYHTHYLNSAYFYDLLVSKIKKNNLVVLIIDLFDINASLNESLLRMIKNNNIVVVATKRDLILKSVKDNKLKRNLKQYLETYDLKIKDIVIASAIKKYQVDEVLDSILKYYNKQDVYMVGITNVGKSSIINAIINSIEKDKTKITTSNYPGTTLDFIKIPIDDYNFLIDTPGIVEEKQIIHYLSIEDYKYIQNKSEVKARNYQLEAQQAVFIGGLVCFCFLENEKSSFNFFVNNKINLHRTKLENVEVLYDEHINDSLLMPKYEDELLFKDFKRHHFYIENQIEKVDIVIDGLGWISFEAKQQVIEVFLHESVGIKLRKAII